MATLANARVLVALVGVVTAAVNGQSSTPSPISGPGAVATLNPIASVNQAGITVIREIVDPFTGNLWLLERDPKCPGGPGRFVLAVRGAETGRVRSKVQSEFTQAARTPRPLLVHSGDPLIVEEHSGKIDANLEAVALDSASLGAPLRVRLKIGGRVLRATAVERGRAILEVEEQ